MENYTKRPLQKPLPENALILVRGRDDNPFMGFVRWGIRYFSTKQNDKRQKMRRAVDHTVIFWHHGEGVLNEIIEANPTGVEKKLLKKYLNDRDGLLVFTNSKMQDPTKYALVKAACYGRVGRAYDFKGLWGFIKRYFNIGDANNPAANFCSEAAAESYNVGGIRTSAKSSGLTSPNDQKTFLLSKEGKKEGWELYDFQNLGTEFFTKFHLVPIE